MDTGTEAKMAPPPDPALPAETAPRTLRHELKSGCLRLFLVGAGFIILSLTSVATYIFLYIHPRSRAAAAIGPEFIVRLHDGRYNDAYALATPAFAESNPKVQFQREMEQLAIPQFTFSDWKARKFNNDEYAADVTVISSDGGTIVAYVRTKWIASQWKVDAFCATKLNDFNGPGEKYSGDIDDIGQLLKFAANLQPWKEYDRTLNFYNRILCIHRDEKDALVRRGNITGFKGKYDLAITDLSRAIELDPKNDFALSCRGLAHYMRGEYEEAVADYTRAIVLRPKTEVYYTGRGDVYAMLHRLDEAVSDYTRALKLDPEDASAYCSRGDVYREQGNYDQALADYNSALRNNRNFYFANVGRAKLYAQLGDYGKAISDFEQALANDPSSADILASLAWLLSTCPDKKFRDPARAIELATQANQVTSGEKAIVLSTLATANAAAGNFDEAIKWQTEALAKLDPEDKDRADYQARLDLYKKHQPYIHEETGK